MGRLLAALLAAGLGAPVALTVPHGAAETPAGALDDVSGAAFAKVLGACRAGLTGAANAGGRTAQDSVLLSGLFLLKKVMPAAFDEQRMLAQVQRVLREYAAPRDGKCRDPGAAETMAVADFWYFTASEASFGPPARPSAAWVDCAVARVRDGAGAASPEGVLQRYIIGQELAHLAAPASAAAARAAGDAAAAAERVFSRAACRPGGELGLLCGYFYTHAMLMPSHFLSRAAQGEAAQRVVDRYAGLLGSQTLPHLEGLAAEGRLDGEARDLAGEVAFLLKAVAGAGEGDPRVRRAAALLRGGPPEGNCHEAVTHFFGSAPATRLRGQWTSCAHCS